MAETISYKNYSVSISLNERTIYLKIIDTINFLSYEGNIDLKELRIPVDLDAAYRVMLNSFKEEKDYSVCINANSGNLKIIFNVLFAGFLKINFDILLREKLMSNDGQLTLNFNKLEQKQAQAIDVLTKKCADLEASVTKMKQIIDCCQIFMTNIYTPQGNWCDLQTNAQTHVNNISAKEITMTDHAGNIIWKNMSAFYQLEKLTINAFTSQINLNNFSNSTIKELILNCNSSGAFKTLDGINRFHNLEILTVIAAPGLKDVVTILKSTKHKIKTLKFQGCAGVNVVELQTYCQVNNVFLALS